MRKHQNQGLEVCAKMLPVQPLEMLTVPKHGIHEHEKVTKLIYTMKMQYFQYTFTGKHWMLLSCNNNQYQILRMFKSRIQIWFVNVLHATYTFQWGGSFTTPMAGLADFKK